MLTWVTFIAVLLGAINWGLVGLFQLDLIAYLFKGQRSPTARLIYTFIGLSGLYILLVMIFRR